LSTNNTTLALYILIKLLYGAVTYHSYYVTKSDSLIWWALSTKQLKNEPQAWQDGI